MLELVPELPRAALEALLPGPYTLVLPNPAQRFRWLTGSAPETIGVRVPKLAGPGAEVLEQVGAVVATSANLHGGPEARTLEDVPAEIRAGAGARRRRRRAARHAVDRARPDRRRAARPARGRRPGAAEALERAAAAFGR